MPPIRSIQQILAGSPKMAIDGRGLERIAANMLTHADRFARYAKDRPMALAHGDHEVDVMPEEAESWREFIKSTGLFPYYVNPDGNVVHTLDEEYKERIQTGAVAVMPVNGTLVREAWSYEEIFWGLVSADRLTKFIHSVLNDARVSGCVAVTNCPGGMVSGTEKLGKAWAALGAAKMTVQHVDDLSASAAYWFGCHSRSIQLVGETADVGSVGVMLSFLDIIPLYEAWGAKYHEIYPEESSKKNEDWRQLSQNRDQSGFKASLGQTAKLFRSVVQQARGAKLSTTDAAVLEGRVYSGADAVAVGLADGIASLEECIHLVRTTTPAAGAPPAADPVQQVPPTVKDDGDANAKTTPNNTPTMSKVKSILSALAEALGFKDKAEVTAETISEANAELKEKGITNVAFVSTEEQQRLADADAQVAAANAEKTSAEEAKAKAEGEAAAAKSAKEAAEKAAADQQSAVQAAAAELGVEVADGTTAISAIAEALKASRAKVAEQEKEIAKLLAQPAPTGQPAGVVSTKGDGNEEENPELVAANEKIKKFLTTP